MGPGITSPNPPPGSVGVSYGFAFTASGGLPPYAWGLSGGGLPGGLSLARTGTISGTPSTAGSSPISVVVTDALGRATSGSYTIVITTAGGGGGGGGGGADGLRVTTADLTNAINDLPYSAQLTASGGTQPYTWAIQSGSLPPGMVCNQFGNISGSSHEIGPFSFTAVVTDASGITASQGLTLIVVGGQLLIVPEPTPVYGGIVNQVYPPQLFKAVAGVPPYTWTFVSGETPPGLQWSVTGDETVSQVAGTPTIAGVYAFTLKITDGLGYTDTEEYAIPVGTPGGNNAVAISTASLPAGQAGLAYPSSQLAAAGGTTPYSWSVSRGQLPPGLALSSQGTIAGTPSAAGQWSADLAVRDATGSSATRGYT
ncbi:MAG: putative Ig domain-containing protein, partial [Blastocatellia bacterium]